MYKSKKTMLAMSALLAVFYLGQAHAHTEIMTFDAVIDPVTGDILSPLMPAAVGPEQTTTVFKQNGFETTAIPFSNGLTGSHIHGAFQNFSRVSQLEADAGGGLFRRDPTAPIDPIEGSVADENFKLFSFDLVTLNTAHVNPSTGAPTGGNSVLHVAGYDASGFEVGTRILTHADEGTTITLGQDFFDVKLVEYWFDAPGRGINPPDAGLELLSLVVELDNVVFQDAMVTAVPEPETYAMLLVGLGLVGFAASRRRNYY